MNKLHKKAVMKACQWVYRAYRPELQDMHSDIVTNQMAEIQQVQTWLRIWQSRREIARIANNITFKITSSTRKT